MSGGWYCDDCGTLYKSPGWGVITCQKCGHLGLRGFDRTPRRVSCPREGCDFTGWDDGGVNDDLGRHIRRVHLVDTEQSQPAHDTGGT